MTARKFLAATFLVCTLGMIASCRPSPYVQTTITNATGDNLQQIQVDYPSASFGKDKLSEGAVYAYRFKLQGSGKPHLEFLDSSGKVHSADGPDLEEGQEGTLDIRIAPAYNVSWAPVLRSK